MCIYVCVYKHCQQDIEQFHPCPPTPRNCPTLSLFAVSPLPQAAVEATALPLSSYCLVSSSSSSGAPGLPVAIQTLALLFGFASCLRLSCQLWCRDGESELTVSSLASPFCSRGSEHISCWLRTKLWGTADETSGALPRVMRAGSRVILFLELTGPVKPQMNHGNWFSREEDNTEFPGMDHSLGLKIDLRFIWWFVVCVDFLAMENLRVIFPFSKYLSSWDCIDKNLWLVETW